MNEINDMGREQRDLRQIAVENANDAIYVITPDGFEFVNPAFEELTGYSEDEATAENFDFWNIIHPDDHEVIRQRERARERGEDIPSRYEFRIIDKQDDVKTVEATTVDIGTAGEARVMGVLRDITQRVQMEDELREKEERLRLALQGGDLGTWDWNLQNDRVEFNERWAEMKGYSLDELEPTLETWEDLVHPDDLPEAYEKLNAHFEGETDFYEAEFRMKHKSGQWIWVLDRGKVIERDADGNPIRACGTHLDITERKRAEEELMIKDDAIASSINAIAIADLQGDLTYVNPTFLDMWGYDDEEEVLGRSVLEFWQGTAEAEEIMRSVQEGEGGIDELIGVRKDGSVFDAQLTASLVTDDEGEPLCMMASFVDITERKRAEEAVRESQQYYHTLFESSRDAIMTLAPPSWKFTSANSATCEMFEVSNESEFTSLDPWNVSPDVQPDGRPSAEKAREMIETALREGSHFFEWTHKRLGGEEFPATVLLTRMDIGGSQLVQATVRDITERKRREEQLETLNAELRRSNQDLQEFTYTVSHDLQAPLRKVHTFGKFLTASHFLEVGPDSPK